MRSSVLFGIVLVVLVAGLLVWLRADGGPASPSADVAAAPPVTAPPAQVPDASAALAPRGDRSASAPEAAAPAADGGAEATVPGTPDDDDDDLAPRDLERALRWSTVDLAALREEMPDNLYWEMGAPTSDPALIEARARERARWNEEWGKVLSGTATEEEIHAYFAHRQKLSTDYLTFASELLDRYRGVLPEQDVALLELSVRMHHTRLQELPRKLAEALERKERQDALREAWLRDEARFAPAAPEGASDDASGDLNTN